MKPFLVWKKRAELEGTGCGPPASFLLFLPVSLWYYHRYAALLTSLMAKDCRYLLDSLLYNPELYPGNNEAFPTNCAYFVRQIMEYFCLLCLRASFFGAWWASPQPIWWVLLTIITVVSKKHMKIFESCAKNRYLHQNYVCHQNEMWCLCCCFYIKREGKGPGSSLRSLIWPPPETPRGVPTNTHTLALIYQSCGLGIRLGLAGLVDKWALAAVQVCILHHFIENRGKRLCMWNLLCCFWLPGVSSGPSCNVELLQSVDALTERQRKWYRDFLTENVFLITLKNVWGDSCWGKTIKAEIAFVQTGAVGVSPPLWCSAKGSSAYSQEPELGGLVQRGKGEVQTFCC